MSGIDLEVLAVPGSKNPDAHPYSGRVSRHSAQDLQMDRKRVGGMRVAMIVLFVVAAAILLRSPIEIRLVVARFTLSNQGLALAVALADPDRRIRQT
jgi:hypothetical protein